MAKKQLTKNHTDKEAMAYTRMIRTSPRKLNYVAALIRNLKAEDALVQLEFSNKRIAGAVLDCLRSAIANAEHNHHLEIDSLYVREVVVGKSLVMKRIIPRARGRASRILKPFSNIRITLREEN